MDKDKVHFPPVTDEENSEEEDYSASVTAIIQRRQSSTRRSRRRSSRRASSPFSPDILPGSDNGRRRSSVFTTSSGDTAITMEESLAPEVTQDQIFENIKLHKEVLSSVKMQPWNMKKKLRLVVQAKNYIKKHQGALQERLAQSHSTKDMLARWNLFLLQRLQRCKREMANLSNWVIPWELRIKEIESHFGSVVASYFIFLRWLFWVNLVTAIILLAFVYIPEMLTADFSKAGDRKKILPQDKYNSTNFLTLWDFEGVFKYSPLFYGWYTNKSEKGYKLPLAYFLTGLAVYTYSFVATLRKMAENSRMSKLSEKDDECIFSWKLFTGWDYMIGNAETAHNRVASIVMSFKEALLEEAEKKREDRSWKIVARRILIHMLVIGLLALSAFAVIEVVKRSKYTDASSTVWRRNETTVVVTVITNFFPILFEILGYFEKDHPRKQLRIQLARIMMLNLLNLYALIFALFDKILDMSEDLEKFQNLTLIEANNTRFTCKEICKEVPLNLSSANLAILSVGAALSMSKLTAPLLTNSQNNQNFNNDTIELYFNNNNTLIIFNETFLENTTKLQNNTFDNFTLTSFEDFDVNSSLTNTETNISLEEHVKNAFQDYLSYILSYFSDKIDDEKMANFTELTTELTTDFDLTTEVAAEELTTNPSTVFKIQNQTETLPEMTTKPNINESSVLTTSISFIEQTKKDCKEICVPEVVSYSICNTTMTETKSYASQSCLRSLCWETMFGQEIVKLTVMDLVYTIGATLMMDFFRGLFVRVMNNCWCWDLEKKFPNYGDFKVAENILHLVNNQGMVWMGMFFSPGLVLINVVKLYIILYLRSWAVLTCNVPHEVIFRASRSNNFYFALLLMMLFLCVLPVGFAIVWQKPSIHCGPFSDYKLIFHIFTKTLRNALPQYFHGILDYIASPGIVIPLLVLLILIIYYLVSLTNSLREANNDLKVQLRRERTEERRKMFQIADRRRRGGSEGSGELSNTPFGKWRKLLQTLPSGKSLDETPKQESEENAEPPKEIKAENIKKDFLSKLLKKALRKSSTTSDEESPPLVAGGGGAAAGTQDDGTDNEQHDSLPEDLVSVKESKPQAPKKIEKSPAILAFRRSITAAINQRRNSKLLENASKDSIDSINADKHVKITTENAPVSVHTSGQIKKSQDKTQKRFTRSPSDSSNNFREDSLTSNWSDQIPAITITKTESAENILNEKDDKPTRKMQHKSEESRKYDERKLWEKPLSKYQDQEKKYDKPKYDESKKYDKITKYDETKKTKYDETKKYEKPKYDEKNDVKKYEKPKYDERPNDDERRRRRRYGEPADQNKSPYLGRYDKDRFKSKTYQSFDHQNVDYNDDKQNNDKQEKSNQTNKSPKSFKNLIGDKLKHEKTHGVKSKEIIHDADKTVENRRERNDKERDREGRRREERSPYLRNKERDEAIKSSETTPLPRQKYENKLKEERRKYMGKPRDLERRPSKTRVLNMEPTLETIASSNDNLDSDGQEEMPRRNTFNLIKQSSDPHEELPIDLIQGTMDVPTTSRSLERPKKFMLIKQHSEMMSDDVEEPKDEPKEEMKVIITPDKSQDQIENAKEEDKKTVVKASVEESLDDESSTDYLEHTKSELNENKTVITKDSTEEMISGSFEENTGVNTSKQPLENVDDVTKKEENKEQVKTDDGKSLKSNDTKTETDTTKTESSTDYKDLNLNNE